MARFIKVTNISNSDNKIIYINVDNIIYMNDIPNGTHIMTNNPNSYLQGINVKEDINQILKLL